MQKPETVRLHINFIFPRIQENLTNIINASQDSIEVYELRYELDMRIHDFLIDIENKQIDTYLYKTIEEIMKISEAKEKAKGISKIELLDRKVQSLIDFVYKFIK